jgi:phenylacetate-coenzyme A ligase PaaK-like adenylate-forming protein
MARIVAELNQLQPGMLMAYSSVLRELARESLAGRLQIAPKMLSVTSEPLLPEIRAAIAEAWPVPLFNNFGSTEGLMGGSCSAQRGLHLSDDLFIIEPVDAAGRPVPAGTRAAKLYLTSLVNLTQPLIRYELTDEVTVLDEPCPCGGMLLRIDDIQGRLDDAFSYPEGPTVHPFAFRSILGRDRNVLEYQVRQTVTGADIVLRAAGAVQTERIAASLCSALRDLGIAEPAVTVTVVDALERQSTGKLRRFIPLKR